MGPVHASIASDPRNPASRHRLFGLTLSSSLPLPCPTVDDDGPVDVAFRETPTAGLEALCSASVVAREEIASWTYCRFADGAARLTWGDHFDVALTTDGREVRWRRLVDMPDEVVAGYLLGQALSFSLLARGIEPLHAAAVATPHGVFALTGESGRGKSTLAAAALARGWRLITDDMLVVGFETDDVWVEPSVPRLKLTPSSMPLFGTRPALTENRFTGKRIFALKGEEWASRAEPLRAIYVLPNPSEPGQTETRDSARHDATDHSALAQTLGVRIDPIPAREAVLSLIGATFNNWVRDPARLQAQLDFAARLRVSVPVCRLSYPKRMDAVPDVLDVIESHVRLLPEHSGRRPA